MISIGVCASAYSTDLDNKYSKLKFLQYKTALEEKGIVYAEGVTEFPKEYFIKLGMPEGAMGPFL
jgi:hypothetical protein